MKKNPPADPLIYATSYCPHYSLFPKINKKDGKFNASEGDHDTVHRIESALIFIETQAKRVLRSLFSIFSTPNPFSYFSRNEDKNADKLIYQNDPISSAVQSGVSIQNIGHATQLIQTPKFNILIDPLFSSPNFLFYPEKTKSCPVEALPHIDVILISNNNVDHCDKNALKKLVAHQPNILVPKGCKQFFINLGFCNVYEFEWYQQIDLKKEDATIQFCAVPADHWSARHFYNVNTASVNGWLINPKNEASLFYYAGDTAKLSEERMNAIAEILYFMNKNKKNTEIYNLENGGPNYTRFLMETTHQSTLDSICSAFRLAIKLADCDKEFEKDPQQRKTSLAWLDKISTVFMQQNKLEIGADRFNENLIVLKKTVKYLNKIKSLPHFAQNEIMDFYSEQQKPTLMSLFNHNKKFIFSGIKELLNLANHVWGEQRSTPWKLIAFLKARVHFPKIGARLEKENLLFPDYNENQKSTYQQLAKKQGKTA